jgi:hypothetical protein
MAMVMGDLALAGHSLPPFNVTAGQSERPTLTPAAQPLAPTADRVHALYPSL